MFFKGGEKTMYTSQQIHITKKNAVLYSYCNEMTQCAKNLRNACVFRMRQHYTSYGKDSAELKQLQLEVEEEITCTSECYPNISVARTISYRFMEKLMRVTENPDFFNGLPMQSAQHILKHVCKDFKGWLSALSSYKKHPEKFTGRPKMPGYTKKDRFTAYITNQDARLYESGQEQGMKLKLPKMEERVFIRNLRPDCRLKEVQIKPFYGDFLLILVTEQPDTVKKDAMPHSAAIDFGVDNIATLVTNKGHSVVYKGGAIKSRNQWFNKQRARLVSRLEKCGQKKTSFQLERISQNRFFFIKDQMHKISTDIIRFCIKHKIGVLYLGSNKGWKQDCNIGKVNNQNFVSIPFNELKKMLLYKGERAGIMVLEQEESYTSKADFLSMDTIPVYNEEEEVRPVFSGRRIQRGLYRSGNGTVLNADINAAANILRKADERAFQNVKDFTYLEQPVMMTYRALNPAPKNM